jgi:rhodanese-related sulfurtransferase
MKLLFAGDGKVLGAQAVGQENVDKQIDVIAAVIQLGGTVRDLERLELGYGPAYNSAKSNINMLGFTAANILDGVMPVFYVENLPDLDPASSFLLDVSTPDEILMSGILPGAVSIPGDELRGRMDELPKNKTIYVACHVGQRGYIAQRLLSQNGFKVYNLSGGVGMYDLVNMDLGKVRAKYEDMQKRFGTAQKAAPAPKAGGTCWWWTPAVSTAPAPS